MTEHRIFELLLKKNGENPQENYDFPKLHPKSIDLIANNLTEIIYGSLQSNSNSNSTNRLNILKLIKCLASFPHVDQYKLICNSIWNENSDTSNLDLGSLINQIETELEPVLNRNLYQKLTSFNCRREKVIADNLERLEFIRRHDQERLDNAGFQYKITKKCSVHPSSLGQLENVLGTAGAPRMEVNFNNGLDYRLKQVQYAYSLVNNGKWPQLGAVLNKIAAYNDLMAVETNFITFLTASKHLPSAIIDIIEQKFVFIQEKALISLSSVVLNLERAELDSLLELDDNFRLIKLNCDKSEPLRLKMQSLLYNLYYLSKCNRNLIILFNKLF